MKKIKQNSINIEPRFGMLAVIDNYMFCYDEEIFALTVMYTDFDEDVAVIDVISTNNLDTLIVTNEDLRVYALNWIFDNVEIVKEVEV